MKVIEILKLNKELLIRIRQAGIRPDDCQYIDLYDEYQTQRMRGEKTTYTVAVLADQYGISERKVYDLIKRFNTDCTLFSAH
jgi:hypothetical protein